MYHQQARKQNDKLSHTEIEVHIYKACSDVKCRHYQQKVTENWIRKESN